MAAIPILAALTYPSVPHVDPRFPGPRSDVSSDFFFLMIRLPPRSPLFPYPPLFRPPLAHPLVEPFVAPAQQHQVRVPGQPLRLGLREPPPLRRRHDDRQRRAAFRRNRVQRPEDRRSEEHTSELQSPDHLVCRLLLEK